MDGNAHWLTLAVVVGGGLVVLLVEMLYAAAPRRS